MTSPLLLEHKLLIAVCLGVPFESPGLETTRGGIDWSRLCELAAEHRIDGLLWQRLQQDDALAAPAEVLAVLERKARANRLDYLAKLAQTSQIHGRLESNGVHAIVLKGCAVGQGFFAPTAGLRFSTDIDILVAPQMHAKAGRILEDCGFSCTHPEPGLPPAAQELTRYFRRTFNYQHASSGIVVELHHCLSKNPDAFPISFDELFERSLLIEVDGARFRSLSDKDCFLYLCYHGVGHGYERLKWLADTARAASKLTDESFAAAQIAATRLGCRRYLELSLHLLRQHGYERLPQAPHARPGIDRLADLVHRRIAAGAAPPPQTLQHLPEYLGRLRYELSLRESARSRLMLLWEVLVHVPDSRLVHLGKDWLWVYALVRGPSALVRLSLRMLGALRRPSLGGRET